VPKVGSNARCSIVADFDGIVQLPLGIETTKSYSLRLNFNAEARRTRRTAEKGTQINSAHLRVLCASALKFFVTVHGIRPSIAPLYLTLTRNLNPQLYGWLRPYWIKIMSKIKSKKWSGPARRYCGLFREFSDRYTPLSVMIVVVKFPIRFPIHNSDTIFLWRQS